MNDGDWQLDTVLDEAVERVTNDIHDKMYAAFVKAFREIVNSVDLQLSGTADEIVIGLDSDKFSVSEFPLRSLPFLAAIRRSIAYEADLCSGGDSPDEFKAWAEKWQKLMMEAAGLFGAAAGAEAEALVAEYEKDRRARP